jgi:EpsD family peptidyl-prolyl cis-trans isomerase
MHCKSSVISSFVLAGPRLALMVTRSRLNRGHEKTFGVFQNMTLPQPLPSRMRSACCAAALVATACTMLLAGCGNHSDKPASQTAARVNKDEITVHQINYVLSQQRALPPDQAASAGRKVLERLIDQELTLQKAEEQKLDRDPRVVQQIDAAKRDIISRAYLEKIGDGAPKPTDAEIKKYYDEHPALFKDRRIYTLQDIDIEAPADQVDRIRQKLETSKNINEFIDYLKASSFRFGVSQAVRAAEQMPLAALPAFAQMKDGQTLFNKTARGALVVVLASSRSQPVDEEHARTAIEKFLLNERKRRVVDDDLKALRAGARIEYVGTYAMNAQQHAAAEKAELDVKPSVSALTAPASSPDAPVLVESPKPTVSPLIGSPASAPIEPVAPVQSASAPSASVLDKGIAGLR